MWTEIVHIVWPYVALIAVILGAAAGAPEENEEGQP